jgi:hypothetical protein
MKLKLNLSRFIVQDHWSMRRTADRFKLSLFNARIRSRLSYILGFKVVVVTNIFLSIWSRIGWSVKLLLGFDSTVISGFNLVEIHDQDFYSGLDMYVFRNGASSSTKEGSVFLCRRYVCCTVVSARVYPRRHGVQVTVDCVHPLSLPYSKEHLCKIYRRFL